MALRAVASIGKKCIMEPICSNRVKEGRVGV
ncbi:hypothetical protein GGR08_000567 [Bartonella fuyuanensis]|uniref:Uncharacterized protein n=1 Tax=Bartonella fuyuanensis TaxID=1460968 RepID=A0A840DT68_9HYPH|nr:hypothetical protein [Bartonella fuyuanensis]